MNILYPYRPGSIDFGPLPKPEEFNSEEEFKNTNWLKNEIVIHETASMVVVDILESILGNKHWLYIKFDNGDLYPIGRLESLEHINKDMIISEQELCRLRREMNERMKIYTDCCKDGLP